MKKKGTKKKIGGPPKSVVPVIPEKAVHHAREFSLHRKKKQSESHHRGRSVKPFDEASVPKLFQIPTYELVKEILSNLWQPSAFRTNVDEERQSEGQLPKAPTKKSEKGTKTKFGKKMTGALEKGLQ